MTIRICSSQEIREIDAIAEKEFLIEPSILMENAGRAASQIILERYPHAGKTTEILVFAGKGNNAGDAFVVARRLLSLDKKVRVFHLEHPDRYSGGTKRNFQILQKLKAKLTYIESIADLDAFLKTSAGPFTVIDGLIGTGLRGGLEGLFYDVVEMINRQVPTKEIIALDIPTGVSGDTGAVLANSIMADLTISFGFPKLGHFLPPGAAKRGELINVDISLPLKFKKEGDKFLLTSHPMSSLLLERDRYGHKNSFGHCLLIGGSPGRLGAITMASRACHRMGTGLVTVSTWEDSIDALLAKLPDETMAFPVKLSGAEFEAYKKSITQFSGIVVGPGLGLRPEGKTLLELLLRFYQGPMVLDADALNLIADHQLHELLQKRNAPTVLTPHPGEMARLIKWEKEKVRENPIAAVQEAIRQTHGIVLLKGAATLIGSPDEKLYLNHYPNDGMATAGSGDVLAGIIGGLLGQRMDPFQATLLGVYLHSLAGDCAAKTFGHRSMTAPDIIANISHAFKEIKKPTETSPHVEGRLRLL